MLEQQDVLDYDDDGNTTEITRSFYHRNALGSVMDITDLNQAIVVNYRYDPYGNVAIERGGQAQATDPLGQYWTFCARFHDQESGLYHYRARFHDPATGRFLQRDPLGYSVGPNLYEYVRSNPTNFTDPTGLETRIHTLAPSYKDPKTGKMKPIPGTWSADIHVEYFCEKKPYVKRVVMTGLVSVGFIASKTIEVEVDVVKIDEVTGCLGAILFKY